MKIRYAAIALAISLPMAGLLYRDFLSFREAREPLPVAARAASPGRQLPEIERFAPIVERGVFPTPVREFRRIDLAAAPAEASSSSLSGIRLIGLYLGPESIAVFEKDGAQSVVRPGGNIYGAGTLKALSENRAVVSSGGRDVSLAVERKELGALKEDGPQAVESGGGAGAAVELDQETVAGAIENMDRLLTDARLTPKTVHGNVVGFTLNEVKKGGIFDRLGLKNGDVLTRVNGFEVDTPEKAIQVVAGLKGETEVEVDIERNGERKSLKYRMR